MTTEIKPATLAELQEQMRIACEKPNNSMEVINLAKAINKFSQDVQKAEVTRLQAESAALAGQREDLEKEIYKAIKPILAQFDVVGMKAKGFTVVVNHMEDNKGKLDPAGTVKVTGGVKLIVPAIAKARTGGNGGGSTGVLKAQTGLSRQEIIDQYATDEEKAAITKAYDEAESRPDSARYSAQKAPIKRILAEHPELIK